MVNHLLFDQYKKYINPFFFISIVLNQKKLKKNSTPDIFKFKNRGMMAYIGKSEALVDMSPVHRNAKNSGTLAWLLWRSAYFSMSMSIKNKLLIPYYWFLISIFGRDTSKF
ncbi:unnamed protein product [Cunninghamella echinulata]